MDMRIVMQEHIQYGAVCGIITHCSQLLFLGFLYMHLSEDYVALASTFV